MGFINKTLKRTRNGEIRLEEDRKGIIGDFFSNQVDTKSHQIVDEENWIVDIDGDVHVYAEDLVDGELPFKIGKLSGNLYTHVRNFKPGLIPLDMDGEIIFVEDEETKGGQSQSSADRDEDELGMGYLREKPKPYNKVLNIIEDALTECINNGYDIDIEAIKEKIQKEWDNRNKYKLTLLTQKKKDHFNVDCEFYIDDPQTTKPLDLTAIEKAVYMVFILHEDGLILHVSKHFLELLQKIYSKIKGRVQDDENGVMAGKFSDTALNSCRTEIRKAIKERISNSRVVDEFAIEGLKADKFKVQRATNEIRQQIKDTFDIE